MYFVCLYYFPNSRIALGQTALNLGRMPYTSTGTYVLLECMVKISLFKALSVVVKREIQRMISKITQERLVMALYYNGISIITFTSSPETYKDCVVLSDLILFSTLLNYN